MYLAEEPQIAKYSSKLKKKRILRGYTQEQLAELSGVNIKSIASYEQNDEKMNSASVGTVLKLVDALGCEVEDIINTKNIFYNKEK